MSRSPLSNRSGFTLTELLVSVAVLVLLIVLVTQLLSSATQITTGSRDHMDADSQARLVFDRMTADFGSMLLRKDVDYVFDKQTGNDRMFFYTEGTGFYTEANSTAVTKNEVSLIGYRINSKFQLERLGKGLSWDGAVLTPAPGGVVFLTYPTGSTTADTASTLAGNWPSVLDPSSTDADYHVVAEQVFRLEFFYLLKTGVFSLTRDTTKGFKDVSAIVVDLAILDNNSRKLVTNFNSLVGLLVDPVATDLAPTPATVPPTLVAKTWLGTVNSSSFAANAGIPQTAASQVRIYQRYFYLNN